TLAHPLSGGGSSTLTVVDGPELTIAGTFFTEVCEIPDDPTSPLSDSDPIPSGTDDSTSPAVSSVQAVEITSSSATIQWLTDEAATSQVLYGISTPSNSTPEDTTETTFHRVTLSGLQPYKVYTIKVRSADPNGNETISSFIRFQTLR